MKDGVLKWFTYEDYDIAINYRLENIERARGEIVKHQKLIEKWQGEIFLIEESRKRNLDGVDDIANPVLANSDTNFYSKTNYNPKWSWYEKAKFVLGATKMPATAKDIVLFLGGLEAELRGEDKEKNRRKAQAAIINTMKVGIKNKEIVEVKTKLGTLYSLMEWEGGVI